MADKKTELSSSYHEHKRTSLLTSGALFLTSLPGVKLVPTLFGTIETGPLPSFVRAVLMAAAIYYLLNFLLVWAIEARPYARYQDHAESDLLKVLEPHLEALNKLEAEIHVGVASIERHIALIDTTSRETRVSVRWDKIEEEFTSAVDAKLDAIFANAQYEFRTEIADLRGEVDMSAESLLSRVQQKFDRIADDRFVLAGALQSRVTEASSQALVDTGAEVAALEHLAAGGLQGNAAGAHAIAHQIKRVRADILVGPWARRALLYGIDLSAPLLVFVVGTAHFVGKLMRDPWFSDAATIWHRISGGAG
jgi:hypothetical protein